MLRREVQACNREKTSNYVTVSIPMTEANCIWEQCAKMTEFIGKQNKIKTRTDNPVQESRFSHEYRELKKTQQTQTHGPYTQGQRERKSYVSHLLLCRYCKTLPESGILIKQQGICKTS